MMYQRRTRFASGAQPAAIAVSLALALLAPAGPAAAEFAPDLRNATTEQRNLLTTTYARITDPDPANDAGALADLDKMIAELREPSPIRGSVQMLRAMALHLSDRVAAIVAIEESVALLPDYSGPLLIGATIYIYDDKPAKAADYVLRASRIDPELVSQFAEYELTGLIHRLSARGERARVADLSERMLAIGWVGEHISSRANLAANAIELRAEAGDRAAAAALIPHLVVPAKARSLLVDNRYQAIWPDIEQWAGSKLEKIWPLYLRQARTRWEAHQDATTGRDYFEALEMANHDATIIWEILPLFSGTIDAGADHDLVFLVAPMARVLARNDRWDEVRALFERANRRWPLGSQANALNVAGNEARYLRYAGKRAEALERMDAVLADAVKRGGEVNQDALVGMHRERACLLHELGKDESAEESVAFVTSTGSPTEIAELQLCFNDHEAAVDALLAGLVQPQWRGSVLRFIQTPDSPPIASAIGRDERERADRLRSDPRLLDRTSQYGRVLKWALSDGAPPETARSREQPNPPST